MTRAIKAKLLEILEAHDARDPDVALWRILQAIRSRPLEDRQRRIVAAYDRAGTVSGAARGAKVSRPTARRHLREAGRI